MSLESNVRRMAGTRPFDLLPREAVQLIAFSCERRMLKAGESLFSAGEPADSAYFILSGELSLALDDAERRVEAGALIGETALIGRRDAARIGQGDRGQRTAAHPRRGVSSRPGGISARARSSCAPPPVARARDFVDQLDEKRARLFES